LPGAAEAEIITASVGDAGEISGGRSLGYLSSSSVPRFFIFSP